MTNFYQLSWNELRELMPGASEDQIYDTSELVSDLLTQKFNDILRDRRDQLNLHLPDDESPDICRCGHWAEEHTPHCEACSENDPSLPTHAFISFPNLPEAVCPGCGLRHLTDDTLWTCPDYPNCRSILDDRQPAQGPEPVLLLDLD
jgi:hypothetical protein